MNNRYYRDAIKNWDAFCKEYLKEYHKIPFRPYFLQKAYEEAEQEEIEVINNCLTH